MIEARLADRPPPVDPRAELLESVYGSVPGELLEMLDRPARPAAVLLGLVERCSGLSIIFTERADSLKEHPGQVSFPGGRIEGDDPSPMSAALREAEEEIGLKAETADLTPADLINADEVFISTSGGGIIPVSRVSDQPIGNGAPGLTSCRLRDLYCEKRALGWHTTLVSELLALPSDKIASAG